MEVFLPGGPVRVFLPLCLGVASAMAQPPVPMPQPKPDWIETLPQLPGRVYALGMVDLSGSQGQSLAKASERAKVEVVARLRATVKGQSATSTRMVETGGTGMKTTGYGERRYADDTSVTTQAEDLPGLTVEKTHLDSTGKAAYALAYLDLAQAQQSIGERLRTLKDVRVKAEREANRRVRWRLRKAQSDLEALDGQAAMLAPAGLPSAVRDAIAQEKEATYQRLAKLETMELPPLDMAKMTVSLKANLDLPPNLSDWLDQQIKQAGLRRRDAGADFVLDLTFQGGSKGPELIWAEPQFLGSIVYRLEAKASLQDAQGVVLGKVTPISLAQDDSARGIYEDFQKIFRRRWNHLIDQLRAELE